MRLRAWPWLVSSSLLLVSLAGATRPRYGGTLTVEFSSAWTSLNPSETIPDSLAESKRQAIFPLLFETLVRTNQKGDIEPALAVTWQHDSDRKRWRFSLRPKIVFHDGEPLNPASAAPSLTSALRRKYGEVTVTTGGQTLVIQSDRAMPDLLSELARSRSAVFRVNNNHLFGTGPFRASAWDPGRRLTLAAFDEYWRGRPYLDAVVINLGATRGLGDVFDIPFAQTRRVLPERTRIGSTAAHELIGLVAEHVQPEIWQALGLTIDRGPIVNVLGQKRAEPAFGLLPQWLSGYAFLFSSATDVPRAKQIISALRTTPLTLSCPAGDSFARSVADRIAVNARDAEILIQPTERPGGNLRLFRWPLESMNAAAELIRIAAMLGLPGSATAIDPAKPEELYDAERPLLDSQRVIPVIYLPDVYGIAPRVHNWDLAQKSGGFALHLDDVWVEP